MTAEHILVQDQDGVRTVTLNRPDKRNALTVAMYEAMAKAVSTAEDDGVGALLFQGSGGFFTGGNDIMDFVANPPTGDDSAVFRFLFAIATTKVPLVVAVEGQAVGVGTTMLLHCDFVYATRDARFHVPFIDLGLVPEAASSILMPRVLGTRRAARMLLLGEPLGAEEAFEAGLVTALAADAGSLRDTALGTARALAAKPRNALRQSKALMKADEAEILATMRKEGAVFAQCLRSPEAMAAFQAFLAKGKR
ncbi:enoyl-CoA hydratase [Aerophototrophica crusticola]|uniref:Enoyl-CoA hydratase n=1 Tax=Aerophototrophica crusticola TaxID=1709002 RepID=A0A858R8K5_9PROT|nr:enoyl-CoA hydratase [Rhodospirillaceae bacterium B3]